MSPRKCLLMVMPAKLPAWSPSTPPPSWMTTTIATSRAASTFTETPKLDIFVVIIEIKRLGFETYPEWQLTIFSSPRISVLNPWISPRSPLFLGSAGFTHSQTVYDKSFFFGSLYYLEQTQHVLDSFYGKPGLQILPLLIRCISHLGLSMFMLLTDKVD